MFGYAVQTERSPEDRERLILEHMPQVNWIASRIQEKLPPNIQIEDLISAGIIGLIAAIDNFDPGAQRHPEDLCRIQNPRRHSGQHPRARRHSHA